MVGEKGILLCDWSPDAGHRVALVLGAGGEPQLGEGGHLPRPRLRPRPAPAVTAAVLICEDPLGLAEQLLQGLDKCLVFFGMCFIEMYLNRRN